MFFANWWNALDTLTQVLYCIAIPSTLLLLVQTVMMFLGIGDDGDAPDTDLPESDEISLDEATSMDALKIFTLRGLISFFVVFSWVGIALNASFVPVFVTLPVAFAAGFLMMVAIAYMLRAVMRLRSDGNTDNRNAIGVAGKVHLTIPPKRSGEGKVHLMLQGSLVERNAVTDSETPIHTGAEVVVVGVSGQTDLVVKVK